MKKKADAFINPCNFKDTDLSTEVIYRLHRAPCIQRLLRNTEFMMRYVSKEVLEPLAGIYIDMLKKSNPEKEQSLKEDGLYILEMVLKCFFSDPDAGSDLEQFIVFVFRRIMKKSGSKSSVDTLLNTDFMKNLRKSYDLNDMEMNYFLLVLLNRAWGWIFPPALHDSEIIEILLLFTEKKETSCPVMLSRINHKLVGCGLFKSENRISENVYACLRCGDFSFILTSIHEESDIDIYDYEKIDVLNRMHIQLFGKYTRNYLEKKEGCALVIGGTENFRSLHYAVHLYGKKEISLYRINPDVCHDGLKQICFHIICAASLLAGKKAVLLVDDDVITGMRDYSDKVDAIPLLSNLAVPAIFCTDRNLNQTVDLLRKLSAEVSYYFSLELPQENLDMERAKNFFFERKMSLKNYHFAVDMVDSMKLSPLCWDKFMDVLEHMDGFSEAEKRIALEHRFGKTGKRKDIRINPHYDISVLNTTPPMDDIISAVKNAMLFQRNEYDSSSGIRFLLFGASGGGKTAFVEHIASITKMPLKRVLASEILDKYVGETEKQIHRLFTEAAEKREILLIDEADSFLCSRSKNLTMYETQMVNEFLVQMELFPGILFCNTNLADELDKAADRRFHMKVQFNPLTCEGIRRLCSCYFQDYTFSDSQIEDVYRQGPVMPGDFGALSGRMRFLEENKKNATYVINELCEIIKHKNRNKEKRMIGFGR